MGLLKRKPRKAIRISEAARKIGCSSESIRTKRIGNFEMFRLTDGPTSPLYCFEAEVDAFIARVQNASDRS